MEIKRDILWRVYLSFIGIVLLSLIVLGRAFYIQTFQGEHWRSMRDSMHQKFVELDAERGTIYSEDGQMLSTSFLILICIWILVQKVCVIKNGKRFEKTLILSLTILATYFGDKSSANIKKICSMAYNEGNRYYPVKESPFI